MVYALWSDEYYTETIGGDRPYDRRCLACNEKLTDSQRNLQHGTMHEENKKASTAPPISATSQLVNRTQTSDAMTSPLRRYEAKCVQRRCFQCGPVPLRSDIKGTELLLANILIPFERQLIALQLCR